MCGHEQALLLFGNKPISLNNDDELSREVDTADYILLDIYLLEM